MKVVITGGSEFNINDIRIGCSYESMDTNEDFI